MEQAVATFLFYSQGICSQPSCFLVEKWKCFHFLKLSVAHPSSFQSPKFLSKLFCIVKVVNDHIKFPLKHNLCIENCSSIKERQKSELHLKFSSQVSDIIPISSLPFQGYSLQLYFVRFKTIFLRCLGRVGILSRGNVIDIQ